MKKILEAKLVTEGKLWDLSPDELLDIKSVVIFYKRIKTLSYFSIPIIFFLWLVLLEIIPYLYDIRGTFIPFAMIINLILPIALNLWARNNIKSIATSYGIISNRDITEIINDTREARKAEIAMNYNKAVTIWERMGLLNRAAHLRTLMTENSTVKVAQKVVHGDEVTKTEIKDSVLNRSNVGGSSKMQELEKLAEMKEKGLIDDDEFKQMKKEILGK